MATKKITLALFRRRNAVLVALSLAAAVAGFGHFDPVGLWDGPL